MEKKATREAYGEALVFLGKQNKNIVVLDADLAKSTRTEVFAKAFPHRFFDLGVAEQNMVGTAAGLALAGKIPFVSSFAIFATGRAFEQIRNTVCSQELNVKIAASHAGITVGEDGASHQSVEDLALMRVLPQMRVVVPADAVETWQAVCTAAVEKGPFYLRLGRPAVPVIHSGNYTFRLGKAEKLQAGKDAAIIATGIMVAKALEAALLLDQEGIEVTVLNMSTIKPLDEEAILEAAKETRAIVTAEEHSIIGGLGSAVAEFLGENYPVPLVRVGIKDRFGESGKPAELLEAFGLTSTELVQAVRKALGRKKGL